MNPSKSLHLVPIRSANDPTVGSFWWYKSTFKPTYKTLWVHLNDLFTKQPNGRVVSKQTFLFVTHRDRVLERLFRFRNINIVGSDCRGFTLNLAPPLISTLYLLLPGLNFMPDLGNLGD